jgi:hypothetical protein
MRRLWTDIEEAKLIDLASQGNNIKQISYHLNKTYNAVYKKAISIGLDVHSLQVGRPMTYDRVGGNSRKKKRVNSIEYWNNKLNKVWEG